MLKAEECDNMFSACFFYFIIELWVGFVNLIQSNWSDSSLEDEAGRYPILLIIKIIGSVKRTRAGRPPLVELLDPDSPMESACDPSLSYLCNCTGTSSTLSLSLFY